MLISVLFSENSRIREVSRISGAGDSSGGVGGEGRKGGEGGRETGQGQVRRNGGGEGEINCLRAGMARTAVRIEEEALLGQKYTMDE